jgi:citrate lyase beta subunit
MTVLISVEIDRASRIKIAFETHGAAGKGAFELDGQMVDAPVYKQVRRQSCLRSG